MSSIKIDYRPELYNPPRNCPLKIGTVALMPGMGNEVDADIWDTIKKNPRLLISDLIEIGIIREIRPAKSKVEKVRKEIVEALEVIPKEEAIANETPIASGVPGSNAEALSLVSDTTDIAVLETWLATETRARIVSALNRRINNLKAAESLEV